MKEKYYRKIRHDISEPALLEGLAEECTEAAKAALKLARVLRQENPTPVNEKAARTALNEEFTDVILYANVLRLLIKDKQYKNKLCRWIKRLKV